MTDKYFKVEAEGDVLYYRAHDLARAKDMFFGEYGVVPESLLKWTEVTKDAHLATQEDSDDRSV